jgi:hypothetical protein
MIISSTAVAPIPAMAAFPQRESGSRVRSLTQWPASLRRSAQRSIAKVTAMAASEGRAKEPNHCPSGGIAPPYSTRLAGLEMGSTKLAALATSAQANSAGRGSALALRAAAKTAGVSTTAVASFDRKVVMTIPAR